MVLWVSPCTSKDSDILSGLSLPRYCTQATEPSCTMYLLDKHYFCITTVIIVLVQFFLNIREYFPHCMPIQGSYTLLVSFPNPTHFPLSNGSHFPLSQTVYGRAQERERGFIDTFLVKFPNIKGATSHPGNKGCV